MKLDPKALEAILKALQNQALMDMADEKSAPDEKMDAALEQAEEVAHQDLDNDQEEGEDPEHVAEVMEGEEGEEKPEMDEEAEKLRDFFKSRNSVVPSRPGTAVMIAVEKKKPMPMKGKKSIRDMMNG